MDEICGNPFRGISVYGFPPPEAGSDMTEGPSARVDGSCPSNLSAAAPTHERSFATAKCVRSVTASTPHLRPLLATPAGIHRAENYVCNLRDVADIFRHGIIFLANDGRIVQMNSAARRLVEAADGLRVTDSRLQAFSAGADGELQSALVHAFGRRDSLMSSSSHLTCERRLGRRPLLVYVVPMDHGHDAMLAEAAVVVVDPENYVEPPKALLTQLFGLTDAETKVALLILAGEEPRTIADTLSVSIATVRTHIHRILSKTGSRRQADLIRNLLALVP